MEVEAVGEDGLTQAERDHISQVMKRAQEFEIKEESKAAATKQPLAGLLYKYTNVMKGWQYRWFQVDAEAGMLEYYYLTEESSRSERPRGSVHLAGAVISPSDEDEQTFSVNAANGDIYRLRAADAKERQHWVAQLRVVMQQQTDLMGQSIPPLPLPSSRSANSLTDFAGAPPGGVGGASPKAPPTRYAYGHRTSPSSTPVTVSKSRHKPSLQPAPPLCQEEFTSAREALKQVGKHQEQLSLQLDALPPPSQVVGSGGGLNYLDQDLLLLKATSQATMACLAQCFSILLRQQESLSKSVGLPQTSTIEWLQPLAPSQAGGAPSTSRRSTQSSIYSAAEGSVHSQEGEADAPGPPSNKENHEMEG